MLRPAGHSRSRAAGFRQRWPRKGGLWPAVEAAELHVFVDENMVRSRLQGGSAEGPTVRGFAAKTWRGARRQPRKNQTVNGTPSAIHARRQAEPFGAGRAAGAPPPQARLVSSAPARRATSVVIRAPQGPRMTGKRRGRRALLPGGGKSARIRARLRRIAPIPSCAAGSARGRANTAQPSLRSERGEAMRYPAEPSKTHPVWESVFSAARMALELGPMALDGGFFRTAQVAF